ncbi:hypothetical protein HJC23_010092 [Cyclotella cryptica]|uniref:Transmembrane protein n=1 Tax=Cyclotella cryptica TaxID=29204 RepID=A0ABD3Q2J3_9STRA|eukprot:CCRYP_009077-RA/>CCRYP_009077-RA protein AED:0.07 eAED:0.07 QI:0/1/0.75/1/0.66/0.5/4/5944/926
MPFPLRPSTSTDQSRRSRSRSRSRSRLRSSTETEQGDEYRRFPDEDASTTTQQQQQQQSPQYNLNTQNALSTPRRLSMEIERFVATPKSSPFTQVVSASESSRSQPQTSLPPSKNYSTTSSEQNPIASSRGELRPSQSFSTPNGSTYTIQSSRYHKGFSSPLARILQTCSGPSTIAHVAPLNQSDCYERNEHEHHIEQQSSHARTDLCSLSLFGVLQSDHTRYLFTHSRPPTLFKRLCFHLFIPVGIFVLAGWFSGHIPNDYVNNLVCTSLVWLIFLWIGVNCVRGRKKRVMVREEILWRLKRREERVRRRREEEKTKGRGIKRGFGVLAGGAAANAPENDTEDDYEYYSEDEEEYEKQAATLRLSELGQTRWEMNCAHRMCGCYPSDVNFQSNVHSSVSNPSGDDYVLQNNLNPTKEKYYGDDNNQLCCTLMSLPYLPCIPCGNNSYGCHPQCCGFCAIAQEAREANLTIPRHLRMIDYITMEPFLLYYPHILDLRRSESKGLLDHCRALSRLSILLLRAWGAILLVLLAMSLWDAIGYWKLQDMMILCATFFQAFGVMYVVHWGWHRFDLSVDAVIKYFACGFALCTGMAFTVEFVLAGAFRLMVMGVIWGLGVTEVVDNGYGGMKVKFDEWGYDTNSGGRRALSEQSDVLYGLFSRHPVAKIIYILVTSYVVAGFIEELTKYFGFLMVDHPDFCSEKELTKAHSSLPLQLLRDRAEEEDDDDNEDHGGGVTTVVGGDEATSLANFDPAMQRRSPSSIRAGVTVAMVAVALGFACCENLLHILIYNRSSLKSEFGVLAVKSLFPIHPLCAAIQSIQVCKRDLEKDTSIGVLRIVLSSVVLHGTYDAALLLLNHSWQRTHKENFFYYNSNGGVGVAVVSCVTLSLILATGYLYYIIRSRAQYSRLRGKPGLAEVGGISLESGFLA